MARAILHADVVAERARLEPAREAILELSSGVRLSYGELDARADRLAAALSSSRGLGLAPGDRVAVLAGNQLRYVELFFAALRSGLVLVNLNTHLTAVELAGVIEDSGARALLYGAGLAERAGAIEAPSLERRVCLSDDAWLADSAHDPPPRALRDPEAACALIYTSGTTGKPKGVMLPSRMLGFNAVTTVIGWQLRDDDITAVFTPLYHAAGFGVFMLPLFCIGGRVVLHRGFDADEVLATVERERCTVVLGVPTIFERLAEHPRFASADLSSLRWVISGGAPLPRYLVDRYAERGVVLKQGFGMTEAGVNCFTMSCAEAHEKAGSIGRPLPFTEARVVDDAGAPLGPDEVGRLQLRGPHLFVGYFGDEQATAAAFDAEGWFDTGDLARTDTDGFFYIAGREKEMFISGGVNVYPAEVEAALLAHPAVRDAAVVAVPDARWGEAGIAAVVAAPGALDEPTLRAFVAERLARFKQPRTIHFIDALPRDDYGKVRKHELRNRLEASKPASEGAGQQEE